MRAPGLTLWLSLGLCALAGAAMAEVPPLSLPGKVTDTGAAHVSHAALRLPVGAWDNGRVPVIDLSGALDQQAWRIEGASEDTLALLAQLTADLGRQGFTPIFSCATDACGGFDFRYAAPILPEPQMHVDLGDFRYQALVKGTGQSAVYAALVVSRSGATAFVQLLTLAQGEGAAASTTTTATATEAPSAAPSAAPTAAPAAAPTDIGQALDRDGHVALDGLAFASGSATLGPGPYGSLAALVAWMAANPTGRLAIVGHSDTSGNAAANRTLSLARAQAVRDRLITLGIAPGRLTADGIGDLAPLTTNATEEGRQKNRRVEAVVASAS